MWMQVQFENGSRAEALIMAASTYEMRVVVEGYTDTQHWERIDGVWQDDSGERIAIGAVIALAGTAWVPFCGELGARTMALGAIPQ
jgi:hypothetical protein